MKRATLRDVAIGAGVSLATVDRVLHGRPGTSPATVARVKEAIEQVKFRRGHLPPGLFGKDEYRFLFVIPRGTNMFMDNMRAQAERMGPRLAERRIFLSFADYAELDEGELTGVLANVNPKKIMGVAVVAVDAISVREAIDDLVRKGVGVVTVVSDVTPSRRHHTIGPNNVATGRVAASLIGKFNRNRSGPIGIIAGSMTLCDQADRRVGFRQVMEREYPNLSALPVREGRDDSATTARVARELLADVPDLVGLYNIGAGNRGLIEVIEESGRKSEIVVVAHELTEHARRALISGAFDAVINQNSAHEIEYAIDALKAFVDGDVGFEPPPISIDVFLRDNVP